MVMTIEALTKKYPLPERFVWKIDSKYTAISKSGEWSHWYVWTNPTAQSSFEKGDVYAHKPWANIHGPTTSVLLANITDIDEACQFMAHKAMFGLYE